MRLHREDEGNVKDGRERERERRRGGRERERERERDMVVARRGKCVSEEKKIDRRRVEGEEGGG